MSTRIFDNPHNVPGAVLAWRLHKADPGGLVEVYSVPALDVNGVPIGTRHYAAVLSDLPDTAIEAGLGPLTEAERAAIARRRAARDEAALASTLRTVTPQQAVDYIESNVTTLASAKAAMKLMVRVLVAMRDEIWPDMPD
jgi:hypothetical protein